MSAPTSSAASVSPKFRPFTFGVTRAVVSAVKGNTFLSADQALRPYAHRMTDRLVHWAQVAPDRTLYYMNPFEVSGGGHDLYKATLNVTNTSNTRA